MENKELDAYLQQLKAMGMDDAMIEMYRQQFLLSMQMTNQMQQNMGAMQANMAEQMGSVLDMFGGDSGITLAEETTLTLSQQWAIACGADLAYLNDHPLNTLSCDADKETMRMQLSEWWGVDGKDELLGMINYLEEGGHRNRFAHVEKALHMSGAAEAKKYLKENMEDFDAAMDWYRNMRAAHEQFIEDELLPENAPCPNLLSWDYVRIINLCRNGFDAKYLSEKEALDIALKAAKVIQQNYKSWKELSISYQFGRYVWGGDDQYDILKEEMEDLLSDENSPWVKLDWNMKLG